MSSPKKIKPKPSKKLVAPPKAKATTNEPGPGDVLTFTGRLGPGSKKTCLIARFVPTDAGGVCYSINVLDEDRLLSAESIVRSVVSSTRRALLAYRRAAKKHGLPPRLVQVSATTKGIVVSFS
jgi:hypothetical protein